LSSTALAADRTCCSKICDRPGTPSQREELGKRAGQGIIGPRWGNYLADNAVHGGGGRLEMEIGEMRRELGSEEVGAAGWVFRVCFG
jgi:hypothetical protein